MHTQSKGHIDTAVHNGWCLWKQSGVQATGRKRPETRTTNTCEELIFCYLTHPNYGLLLRFSKQTCADSGLPKGIAVVVRKADFTRCLALSWLVWNKLQRVWRRPIPRCPGLPGRIWLGAHGFREWPSLVMRQNLGAKGPDWSGWGISCPWTVHLWGWWRELQEGMGRM